MHNIHQAQRPISALFSALGLGAKSSTAIHATEDDAPHVIDKPWILCVDDDQEFSHGLKLRLQTRGYDVVRAFAGMDGYRYAFEFNPSVILLDLHLPNLSGEEVLSQIRFHPSTAHIPVAIVTGMSKPGLEQKMLSLGANAFFQKPVDFSRLADIVDQFASQA